MLQGKATMVDLVGLAIPFAYLGILVGSLATFSSLYRKRKAGGSPFPQHIVEKIQRLT